MEGICTEICSAIKDEKEGQEFYKKLAEELRNEGYPEESEAVKVLVQKDEKKHEEYMEILKQAHNCSCK